MASNKLQSSQKVVSRTVCFSDAVVYLATGQSTCLNGQNTQLTNTDAELRLKADEFVTAKRYNTTFYFTVLAKNSVKTSRVSGNATQGVQLSAQPVLQIFIECIANCGPLMNPSYRLVLSAQCKVCHNMSYTWQLDSDTNNTVKRLMPEQTLNGLREPVLNVNPRVFVTTYPETYLLTLSGQHHLVALCKS